MAIRLYLHIGQPQAETGHILALLADNAAHLRRQGYGVVTVDPPKGAGSLPSLITEERRADVAAFFSALKTKAEHENLEAVVLSLPGLCHVRAAGLLATARGHFDCRVVYYFHRQDDHLVAAWAAGQYMTGIGLAAYIEQHLASAGRRLYRDVLEAYLEHFSAANMRVRLIWAPVLEQRSLSQDFWRTLDLGDVGLPDTPVAPPEISPDLAEILGESPYLFAGTDDHEMTDFITSLRMSGGVAKANPLDIDVRRKIMQHYQPENRWIKQTFFADVHMAGWNAVPDSDDRSQDVTMGGIAEAINLNLAMLKDLQQDVGRIKRKMGLK
ncbi:hypothetical protein [Kordiimonas aestuarii]|uniref:hypothetical protein n=1 Tax=Kordiimonas aestuarii TaxID=1005925 RepID=UPI0021CF0309|nr:hypothetical protein [Kordiimonas aestuarii]